MRRYKVHLIRGRLSACGRVFEVASSTTDPALVTCWNCREAIDAGALPKMEPAPSRFELVLE